VAVHDVTGRRVRTLLDAELPAGRRTVWWDGEDASGSPCPSGIYFIRLRAADRQVTGRIALIR